MKTVSFDNLFESEMLKTSKTIENSNSTKISNLKNIVMSIIKNELSEKQRTVLDMYFVKKMNCSQIANQLNVNKSTISKTKSRAFQTIYKILKYYDFR